MAPPKPCGNGTCEPGESTQNCPADCQGGSGSWTCGDGKCDIGEQFYCQKDCTSSGSGGGWVCGDGKCDIGEKYYCQKDCQAGGATCLSTKCVAENNKCNTDTKCKTSVQCSLGCNGDWACLQKCLPGGTGANQTAVDLLICGQKNNCL
ncbi:MAG: hypothetical protein EXR77_17560 [Myxococcales bacterium]|nr:hypothetical protein [Myxococcales bacterium]